MVAETPVVALADVPSPVALGFPAPPSFLLAAVGGMAVVAEHVGVELFNPVRLGLPFWFPSVLTVAGGGAAVAGLMVGDLELVSGATVVGKPSPGCSSPGEYMGT